MAGGQSATMSAPEPLTAEGKQKLRTALKREFQKKISHPLRFVEHHEIVDPGIQRYMSANVSHYDYFKATAKTARFGILYTLAPMLLFGYLIKKDRDDRENKLRTGQVAYRDRDFKFK